MTSNDEYGGNDVDIMIKYNVDAIDYFLLNL